MSTMFFTLVAIFALSAADIGSGENMTSAEEPGSSNIVLCPELAQCFGESIQEMNLDIIAEQYNNICDRKSNEFNSCYELEKDNCTNHAFLKRGLIEKNLYAYYCSDEGRNDILGALNSTCRRQKKSNFAILLIIYSCEVPFTVDGGKLFDAMNYTEQLSIKCPIVKWSSKCFTRSLTERCGGLGKITGKKIQIIEDIDCDGITFKPISYLTEMANFPGNISLIEEYQL